MFMNLGETDGSRIYLMTYDASGSWDKALNHHAPLHSHNGQGLSAASTIQFYHSRGVPLHKLILGVPMYSRSFITSTGQCGHHYERVCGPQEDATSEGTHMYNVRYSLSLATTHQESELIISCNSARRSLAQMQRNIMTGAWGWHIRSMAKNGAHTIPRQA